MLRRSPRSRDHQLGSYVIGFTLANGMVLISILTLVNARLLGILTVRTLAIWNRSKIILSILLTMLVASLGPAYFFAEKFVTGETRKALQILPLSCWKTIYQSWQTHSMQTSTLDV
jgi:hypothetical protein